MLNGKQFFLELSGYNKFTSEIFKLSKSNHDKVENPVLLAIAKSHISN